MVASLEDRVLDFGLNVLDIESTHLLICGHQGSPTEPTTYAQASTTYLLGFKSWGSGNVFGTPHSATTSRQVSSAQINDGTITTTGTAAWWAVTDSANSRLLAHGSLSASQAVTGGNSFTLAPFNIRIPNQ